MASLRISLAVLSFLAGMIIVHCRGKCQNGGTVKKGVSTVCQCRYGFKGFKCSERVLPCEGRPCLNNGKCRKLPNRKFKCLCSRLFTGAMCQKRVFPCDSGPCKNGGKCINKGATCFKCECGLGFKGSDCSQIVKPCELKPCKNGGVCRNINGNYQCTCKNGFRGVNCDKKDALCKSKILKKKVAWMNLLDKWIGGQENDWRLCYRATQHGWRAADFHKRCDNRSPILSIVRVGRRSIFGGYSDVSFGGNSRYVKSYKSFIFSLQNKDNTRPFKSVVYRPQNAIYTNPSYGITFGGGHDICIKDNARNNRGSYSNFGHTYQVPSRKYKYTTTKAKNLLAGGYNFSPNEIEVFYVE